MTPLLETPGDTERIRIYQTDAGLVVDGVLGPMTRSALIADELASHITEFVGFTGSFGLLIRCEGFRGRPYVPPGANAGVTLDYGWDLGQQTGGDLERLYGDLWRGGSTHYLQALHGAVGLRGKDAREWVRTLPKMAWITREQAAQILPRAAAPYWLAAVRACPALAKAPARVQTAMLSVTYSAWIEPVQIARPLIEEKLWRCLAGHVRTTKGSKGRREMEAQLIEGVQG